MNTSILKSVDLSDNFKNTSDEERMLMDIHFEEIPSNQTLIDEIILQRCEMDKENITTIIHLLRFAKRILFSDDNIVTSTKKDEETILPQVENNNADPIPVSDDDDYYGDYNYGNYYDDYSDYDNDNIYGNDYERYDTDEY